MTAATVERVSTLQHEQAELEKELTELQSALPAKKIALQQTQNHLHDLKLKIFRAEAMQDTELTESLNDQRHTLEAEVTELEGSCSLLAARIAHVKETHEAAVRRQKKLVLAQKQAAAQAEYARVATHTVQTVRLLQTQLAEAFTARQACESLAVPVNPIFLSGVFLKLTQTLATGVSIPLSVQVTDPFAPLPDAAT